MPVIGGERTIPARRDGSTIGMNDSSDTTPASVEDIDLYCLQCGYNLRGQSGDPRRCPECF